MKYSLFFVYSLFSISLQAQEVIESATVSDTIPIDENWIPKEIAGQSYQIEPDLYFTYQKPKFWD